jgi:hypothetical protein
VELHVDDRLIDPILCSDADLQAATFVSLTFTTQKNGTNGEVITHGLITNDLACPVKATVRHIFQLRQHKATKDTPITSYFQNGKYIAIKATNVTQALRMVTIATEHQTGLKYSDIIARTLCSGGAMALVCGRIDHNTIRMIGRWHSDAMLRYFHLHAKSLMRQLSVTMFNHGTYSFLPTNTVPSGDY